MANPANVTGANGGSPRGSSATMRMVAKAAPIDGDPGPNFLTGTEDNDVIRGFDGNDNLSGLGGLDSLLGGDGNDSLSGGNGIDTLNGGAGDDTLVGVGTAVLLSTGGPSDVIDGGAGIDTLTVVYAGFIASGTGQPPPVTIDISIGSGEVIVGGFRGENFSRIERLIFIGPDGADVVTGGKLNDTIDGRGGNDILRAGEGDDFVLDGWGFVDADGGDGWDRFSLDLSTSKTVNAVVDCRVGRLTIAGVDMGAFLNFESFTVTGTTGSDSLFAHADGSTLIGFLGNDTIRGGNGNDIIDGDRSIVFGGGDDVMFGGAGNDRLSDLNGNNTFDAGSGNDTILAVGLIDQVIAGTGDDFVGWRLNRAVAGGSYDGGAGYDIISFDVSSDTIDITVFNVKRFEELREFAAGDDYTVKLTTAQFEQFQLINLPSGSATLALSNNADVVLPETSIFEELQLADGGQTVDFDAVDSDEIPFVTGGSGDDTVIGIRNIGPFLKASLEDGNDTFTGGAGRERVFGGNGGDTIDGGNHSDLADGGRGKDVLLGGAGNDTINGGADADELTGGAGRDRFVYSGAADSRGKSFDTVFGFDFNAQDRFDLRKAVTGIDAAVTQGDLSNATFAADLAAAIGSGQLGIAHALLFQPDAGDHADETFLIIDMNGKAGYQANADLVINLKDPANLVSLDTADFV